MKGLESIVRLLCGASSSVAIQKNLIIDTDLFSDVDDAGALLLAATSPSVNLLAVNVNYPSSYSALAASAILAHYGQPEIPIGILRPLTNVTFFDGWYFKLSEFTSKVAYHHSGGSLPWGQAEKAWDPIKLYRKALAEAKDGSVTIASIGFLDNLSGLLNSTADSYSDLSGPKLVSSKVSELVVMGGGYPSGHSWNFWGSDPSLAAHAIHGWKGKIVFVGDDVGKDVRTGGLLMSKGPENDPVRMAYEYYAQHKPTYSWDPLAMLYAIEGLGDLFKVGGDHGYNHIESNGSNRWVWDEEVRNQSFLRLAVSNKRAEAELDKRLLQGAQAARKGVKESAGGAEFVSEGSDGSTVDEL